MGARVAAFFSWVGVVIFTTLVFGTLLTWLNGAYKGGLAQWLLQELVQGALLGLSVWGAVGSARRRTAFSPAARGTLLMLAVMMGGFVVFGSMENRKAGEEAFALAPPVIAALARFKAAQKEYPRTLEDLVPAYLPALPGCKAGAAGSRMAYWREAVSGEYELTCPAFMFMRYSYRSATGTWHLSD